MIPSATVETGPVQTSVLRIPGVARLFGLGMVARTPEAALAMLFILRTRELGGSFALAGLVSATIGITLALGGPFLGRLIDRRGQTPILIAASLIAALPLFA